MDMVNQCLHYKIYLLTLVNEILETSRNKHMYNNLVNNCTDLWLSFPKQQIVTEACLWQLSASFRLDTLYTVGHCQILTQKSYQPVIFKAGGQLF